MKNQRRNKDRSGRQESGVNFATQHLPHGATDTATKCPRVFIKTFGCQMNTRDSEALVGLLQASGYQMADSEAEADIILFNTCSVRQHAEEKVWSELGSLKKLKIVPPIPPAFLRKQERGISRGDNYPEEKIIGVIGCMAQNYKDEIFRRAPYVDLVVGPNDLLKIPTLIKQIIKEKTQALAVDTLKREEDFYVSNFRTEKDHAFVVISEGCNNFCSYCVVPYVRGRLRCRDYHHILNEIKITVDSGIKNITLLGQNVNSYEFNGVDFVKLLNKVNAIDGLREFDFVTSHPKDANEKLFFVMNDLDKCRKFLHLPIQSGSDRILKLMNRGYTKVRYRSLAEKYQRIVSGKLSTDIIVGFPTETEEDFNKTLDLVKDIKFDSAYIFKYSPRPRTKAEDLADNVTLKEKQRRHKILLDLQKEISRKKKQKRNSP